MREFFTIITLCSVLSACAPSGGGLGGGSSSLVASSGTGASVGTSSTPPPANTKTTNGKGTLGPLSCPLRSINLPPSEACCVQALCGSVATDSDAFGTYTDFRNELKNKATGYDYYSTVAEYFTVKAPKGLGKGCFNLYKRLIVGGGFSYPTADNFSPTLQATIDERSAAVLAYLFRNASTDDFNKAFCQGTGCAENTLEEYLKNAVARTYPAVANATVPYNVPLSRVSEWTAVVNRLKAKLSRIPSLSAECGITDCPSAMGFEKNNTTHQCEPSQITCIAPSGTTEAKEAEVMINYRFGVGNNSRTQFAGLRNWAANRQGLFSNSVDLEKLGVSFRNFQTLDIKCDQPDSTKRAYVLRESRLFGIDVKGTLAGNSACEDPSDAGCDASGDLNKVTPPTSLDPKAVACTWNGWSNLDTGPKIETGFFHPGVSREEFERICSNPTGDLKKSCDALYSEALLAGTLKKMQDGFLGIKFINRALFSGDKMKRIFSGDLEDDNIFAYSLNRAKSDTKLYITSSKNDDTAYEGLKLSMGGQFRSILYRNADVAGGTQNGNLTSGTYGQGDFYRFFNMSYYQGTTLAGYCKNGQLKAVLPIGMRIQTQRTKPFDNESQESFVGPVIHPLPAQFPTATQIDNYKFGPNVIACTGYDGFLTRAIEREEKLAKECLYTSHTNTDDTTSTDEDSKCDDLKSVSQQKLFETKIFPRLRSFKETSSSTVNYQPEKLGDGTAYYSSNAKSFNMFRALDPFCYRSFTGDASDSNTDFKRRSGVGFIVYARSGYNNVSAGPLEDKIFQCLDCSLNSSIRYQRPEYCSRVISDKEYCKDIK